MEAFYKHDGVFSLKQRVLVGIDIVTCRHTLNLLLILFGRNRLVSTQDESQEYGNLIKIFEPKFFYKLLDVQVDDISFVTFNLLRVSFYAGETEARARLKLEKDESMSLLNRILDITINATGDARVRGEANKAVKYLLEGLEIEEQNLVHRGQIKLTKLQTFIGS